MKPVYDKRRRGFLVTVDPEGLDQDVIDKIVDAEDGDDDGEAEPRLLLPARLDVCGKCDGTGKHWPDAFDNGFTAEDRERDWDDESWGDLMAGKYDVRCTECKGENVVPVPRTESLTKAEQVALDAYNQWWDDERAYRAEVAAERRMGC